MSNEIRNLEPEAVWNHFADLNAVPRPSKKEERVIEFMKNFGKEQGLETTTDEVGNVLIRKPATAGMEDRATVILQAHLDMVHQKNNDTDFDFDREGIRSYVDGDWVRADGTTLGADNGLGVAMSMSILSSDQIEHPDIEALFTIDEETGMTGAKNLKPGWLKGDILLNLDTEDDDEITIGCAGGVDTTARASYDEEQVPGGYSIIKLNLKGLAGGHSGMDIDSGRANANKLMNRLLFDLNADHDIRISSINGGGLRNAIPRESVACIAAKDADAVIKYVEEFEGVLRSEYKEPEPELKLTAEKIETDAGVMPADFQDRFLKAVYAMPNGVFRMSPAMPELVETSTNLARVEAGNGKIETQSLQRSSVESQKKDVAAAARATYQLMDADVEHTGDYPGWEPDTESPIKDVLADTYRELFNEEPKVMACHAGLECGIIGTHYQELDMISFGPTINNPHSPDECTSISSLQKSWKLFLETLKRTPTKSEVKRRSA